MARARLGPYDLAGVGLATLLAAWIFVTAAVRDGNPWPQIALLIVAVAAYVIGRSRGPRPVFVAGAIVLGILGGVVLGGPAAVSGGALAPPLGYANANGALFALGAAAAATVAVATEKERVRQPAMIFAVVMFMLAAVNTSKAAITVTAMILAAALLAQWLGRWVALVAPIVVAAAVGTTIVLGATHGTPVVTRLEASLTGRRTELWQEALAIIDGEPVFGVGPGMFAKTSPTALSDADAVWAHSAYLEVAAEHGIVGVALLGLLVLWVFGGLYRSHQDPRLVVIGTAAATAFAVHAAIDYVAHFPAAVIVASLLVGLASSRDIGSIKGSPQRATEQS